MDTDISTLLTEFAEEFAVWILDRNSEGDHDCLDGWCSHTIAVECARQLVADYMWERANAH